MVRGFKLSKNHFLSPLGGDWHENHIVSNSNLHKIAIILQDFRDKSFKKIENIFQDLLSFRPLLGSRVDCPPTSLA